MREIDNVIVVSDANIFIDLCNVGLLEDFFLLPWHIHTTDIGLFRSERTRAEATTGGN